MHAFVFIRILLFFYITVIRVIIVKAIVKLFLFVFARKLFLLNYEMSSEATIQLGYVKIKFLE